MKTILLDKESIERLAEIFFVDFDFVQSALNMIALPELSVVSKAKTLREVEEEQIDVESCCNEEERAAFRRWIELAAGNEREIIRVFGRIGDCEDAEPEKMLAIRAMAEILLKEKK